MVRKEREQKMAGKECNRLMTRDGGKRVQSTHESRWQEKSASKKWREKSADDSLVAMAGKEREQKMAGTSTVGMVQSQGGIKAETSYVWCKRFPYRLKDY